MRVGLRERLAGYAGIPGAAAPAQELSPLADAEDDERLVAVGLLPVLRVLTVLAHKLRESVGRLHGALPAGEVAPDNDEESPGRIAATVRH